MNAGESAPSGPEQRCNFTNGQGKSFYVSYAPIADLGPIDKQSFYGGSLLPVLHCRRPPGLYHF